MSYIHTHLPYAHTHTHLLLSPMVLDKALTLVYLYERSLHMIFFLVLFWFILCVILMSKTGRLFYSPSSPHLSRGFSSLILGICSCYHTRCRQKKRKVLKRKRGLWQDCAQSRAQRYSFLLLSPSLFRCSSLLFPTTHIVQRWETRQGGTWSVPHCCFGVYEKAFGLLTRCSAPSDS